MTDQPQQVAADPEKPVDGVDEASAAAVPPDVGAPVAVAVPERDEEFVATVLPGDDPGSIAAASDAVAAGACIVLPTDTVYGIGADPFNAGAVQRLQEAKRRGSDTPPPVLIASAFQLETLADHVPQEAHDLADAFWPGPLTLILTAQRGLRMDLGDAEGTIALRIPAHPVALDILRATGPLAVSSANVHGEAPGTSVAEAVDQLGAGVAVYVDGGATPGPVPSSIVDLTTRPPRVLRVGVLSVHDLQRIVADLEPPQPAAGEAPETVPGPSTDDEPDGVGGGVESGSGPVEPVQAAVADDAPQGGDRVGG